MGRKSRGAKPQSGIPGLLWRQRGNRGSWVVSLNVPTELRGRIVSSTGKPLARLERSTKTDSLSLAKRRYSEVMTGLKAELEDKVGRSLETGLERAKRAVANAYIQQTSDQYLDEINKMRTEFSNAYPQAASFIGEFLDDWLHIINRVYLKADQQLTDNERRELDVSLSFAIKSARETNKIKAEQGLFAEQSAADKMFRKVASTPKPASIDDVLKLKRDELGERTFSNLKTTIKNWKRIIGSNRLDSITAVNLNRFARCLKKPKPSGGNGFTTNAANDASVRIRSLIKTYNVNIADEASRLSWPEFEPIPLTTAERKDRKLEVKAVNAEDAKKVLKYAAENNQGAWRALLILCNSTFRASEVCSLRWGHIKELNGITYFDLTDSKTVEGIRRFPLNSRLRVHLLPLRGSDEEFIVNNTWPNWSRPKDGLGYFLSTAKKTLGIQGRVNPHSFRHAAGGDLGYHLPEHIKKKLMGHAGGLTDHYTREDMKVLADAVEFIGTELDCL